MVIPTFDAEPCSGVVGIFRKLRRIVKTKIHDSRGVPRSSDVFWHRDGGRMIDPAGTFGMEITTTIATAVEASLVLVACGVVCTSST